MSTTASVTSAPSSVKAEVGPMRLERIVFTGGDDSTDIPALCALAQKYAHCVEFGFLVCSDEVGKPKYPTVDWLHKLHAYRNKLSSGSNSDEQKQQQQSAGARSPTHPFMFSAHICNGLAARLAVGDGALFEHPHYYPTSSATANAATVPCVEQFERLQLNFSRQIVAGTLDIDKLCKLLVKHPRHEYVFQLPSWDSYGLVEHARKCGIRAFGFFDPSAGTGKSPTGGVTGWPKPPQQNTNNNNISTANNNTNGTTNGTHGGGRLVIGYAGGLGPANLLASLNFISSLDGQGGLFWVDMETNVRTDNKFDLTKVTTCLEIAQPFLATSASTSDTTTKNTTTAS